MTMINFKNIASYVWPGAYFCYSEVEGAFRGVATLWNLVAGNGSLICSSKFYLITKHRMGDKVWNFFNVYAPNTRNGRYNLWEELSIFLSQNRNTFCMGDFNSLLYPSEKVGGMIDFNDSMKDLANFINNNYLMDMEMHGVKFTWSNNRKGVDLIQVKLDRLLVPASWDRLTSSSLMGLPKTVSNHSLILFNWKEDSLGGPRNIDSLLSWKMLEEICCPRRKDILVIFSRLK